VGIQIIIYILFFISIFSALIYNEIIIINLWSLNVNTKKYISKRQEYDTQLILNAQIENIEKTDVFEDTSDL
jgi:5-bromo-4-chloroindolyl phosphate hydrolysis protein